MAAWKEIVDYTVPSNTTSVTFNNFGTITKDDFIKINATIVNNNVGNVAIGILGNSSVSSNYHRQSLSASGSIVAAARANDHFVSGINALKTTNMMIYGKLSENDRLNLFSNTFQEIDSAVQNTFFYTTSSGVTFADHITSLTFTSNVTNGIGAGSRIQIYKLTAKKVADILVTSNTTQVDITGLDIKKGDEYLLVGEHNWATLNQGLSLFANNNTTATNYFSQQIRGNGSNADASRTNGSLIVNSAQPGQPNLFYSHIKLSNIGAYTAQNYVIRRMGSELQTQNYFLSSSAENITSITNLTLSTNNNGIGSGSRFELYRLYKGGN